MKWYIIANSLSRYCTYLLVSKPGLIPDSFLVPKMVFRRTVKDARDKILVHCDSLESRYTKLSLEGYKAAEASDKVKKGDDVLKQGALLAKELLDHEGEACWEILAGVWTELLIHIAPTWNAVATQDPDTANLRTRSMVGTESSETEEASQDAAGTGTNVQSQNGQQVNI
jgi:hypothetical protein